MIIALAGFGWWYFHPRTLPDYGPAYREYAYVTNGKSNSVTVIDLRTFEPAKTIPVGTEPTGVAANSKKNEIYVVNTGSNNVSVIDAERNQRCRHHRSSWEAFFIDVSADGKRGYVANSGSANVSVIDLDQRPRDRHHPCWQLARTGTGFRLTAAHWWSAIAPTIRFQRLTLAQLVVRATIPVCQQPEDIAILPDNSKAFVACTGSAQVASIDLKTGTLLALLDVGKTPVQSGIETRRRRTYRLQFRFLQYFNYRDHHQRSQRQLLDWRTSSAGVVTADNSRLYVSNFGSDAVAVYDIDLGKLIASLTGGQPSRWARSIPESKLFAGPGFGLGRCDRNSKTKADEIGAYGIFPANHDPGGSAAEQYRGEIFRATPAC